MSSWATSASSAEEARRLAVREWSSPRAASRQDLHRQLTGTAAIQQILEVVRVDVREVEDLALMLLAVAELPVAVETPLVRIPVSPKENGLVHFTGAVD